MIEHELVKAMNVPVIIHLISDSMHISEGQAQKNFYESATYKCLSDETTGLYGQSPLFIANMYLQEYSAKSKGV